MNLKIIVTFTLLVLVGPLLQAQEFKSIFNGKDLSGWSGDESLWSVKDGAITGITSKDAPIPHNKFLIW